MLAVLPRSREGEDTTRKGWTVWRALQIDARSCGCCHFKMNESSIRTVIRKEKEIHEAFTATTPAHAKILHFLWKTLLFPIKNAAFGASLVVQWLRICLPMQGTRVRALVWEDPTCRGATRPVRHNYWACILEPVSHNYWACASGACAAQQERPRQWEARAPRWRVAPTRRN